MTVNPILQFSPDKQSLYLNSSGLTETIENYYSHTCMYLVEGIFMLLPLINKAALSQ